LESNANQYLDWQEFYTTWARSIMDCERHAIPLEFCLARKLDEALSRVPGSLKSNYLLRQSERSHRWRRSGWGQWIDERIFRGLRSKGGVAPGDHVLWGRAGKPAISKRPQLAGSESVQKMAAKQDPIQYPTFEEVAVVRLLDADEKQSGSCRRFAKQRASFKAG